MELHYDYGDNDDDDDADAVVVAAGVQWFPDYPH